MQRDSESLPNSDEQKSPISGVTVRVGPTPQPQILSRENAQRIKDAVTHLQKADSSPKK
jgi:hypothetical protein